MLKGWILAQEGTKRGRKEGGQVAPYIQQKKAAGVRRPFRHPFW